MQMTPSAKDKVNLNEPKLVRKEHFGVIVTHSTA